MTKTCCIPGCKSNYNSTLKAGRQPVSTFKFPEDEVLRSEWVKSIQRDNWVPSKYSVVCALHFPAADIVRTEGFSLIGGILSKGISKRKTLVPYAVPSIFPNSLHYLSKNKGLPRKSPEERRRDYLSRNDHFNEIFEKSDLIVNFQDLILHYSSKINIPDSWNVKMGSLNNKIHFYRLNLNEEMITITNQITVNEDMLVTVVLNGKKVFYENLRWILPFDLKLDSWSQIEKIMTIYNKCKNNEAKHEEIKSEDENNEAKHKKIESKDKNNEAQHKKTKSKNKRKKLNT